jgi:hypothetical protein
LRATGLPGPACSAHGSQFDLEYATAGIAAVAALLGRPTSSARLWGVVERLDGDAERKMDRDDRVRFERVLGAVDEAEREAGRALGDEQAIELLRETTDKLGALMAAPAPL